MLEFLVRKGRFGFFMNPFYSKLGSDQNITLLEGTILQRDIKVDTTLRIFIMSFGVGYRLGPYRLCSREDGHTSAVIVEPYVGGRLTQVDVELDLVDRGRRFEDDIGWVDPMFGVLSVWNLYPRWNVTLGGDVGGFGVGTDLKYDTTMHGPYVGVSIDFGQWPLIK
ncbi:MAG: hypothetical protein E4G90_09510 [Gemmatimonadales bacterium]|nr:MAG: hypothetical protein E4G90_09510 [Gemmatimonadales bacterium]